MKWMQRIAQWFAGSRKSYAPLSIGLRAALGGGAPGGWASDHREETAHNTGFNYIAIHAIAAQVSAANVTVYADGSEPWQRRARRKALAARFGSYVGWKSTYGADDRESHPLPPDHPLVQLLRRPNPHESGADFRYRQAQQIRLTGTCLVWNVPSVTGPACERYVIPTAMASPVAPAVDLPRGGWRISPVASRYTPVVDDSYVDCPSWYRILGQVIDARQVQLIRLPHAWYLDDGQSPLSAGAMWVDACNAVDEARYHQLKNGIDPSLVWNLPPDVSPDQDEIDRVQAKISAKYGGPENVGRVMVAQNGTTITPLSAVPKDMCYSDGFLDFKAAILALHQTPPVAVGIQEPGAYAAYNASMKAWRHAAIQPLCDMLAESDTEHLAPQFGTGLTIEIESAVVDDAELLEQQLQNDLAAKVRTRNEWRAVRGLSPLPSSLGEELIGTDHAEKPALRTEPPVRGAHTSNDPFPDSLGHQEDSPDDHSFRSHRRRRTKAESADPGPDRVQLICEILYGIFGPQWLQGGASNKANFDPSQQRDRLGRWSHIGAEAAAERIKQTAVQLLQGQSSPSVAAVHELVMGLGMLSTEELRSVHQGLPIELPSSREQLQSSVIARVPMLTDYSKWWFRMRRASSRVSVVLQNEAELQRRWASSGLRSATPPSRALWGQLIGAAPGATVHVFPSGFSQISFVVDHRDYHSRRTLGGDGVLTNEIMIVSPEARKQGLASRILMQQIRIAREQGVRRIEVGAAGTAPKFRKLEPYYGPPIHRPAGYYVWPRLGFSGDLRPLMEMRRQGSKRQQACAAEFAQRFPHVNDVADLMATPEGRRWWKTNGGTLDVHLDLTPRNTRLPELIQRLEELAATTGRKTALLDVETDDRRETQNKSADATSTRQEMSGHAWLLWGAPYLENPDELTADEEALLDRVDQREVGPGSTEPMTSPADAEEPSSIKLEEAI